MLATYEGEKDMRILIDCKPHISPSDVMAGSGRGALL